MVKVNFNGVEREATAEEQAEYDARQTEWANGAVARKLERIKELRLIKRILNKKKLQKKSMKR